MVYRLIIHLSAWLTSSRAQWAFALHKSGLHLNFKSIRSGVTISLIHKPQPGKRLSLRNVVVIFFKSIGFPFEWNTHIRFIVRFTFQSSDKIKGNVKQPMKNEKKFYLLPEMDELVIENRFLVSYTLPIKNENEKSKTSIVSK